MRDLVDSGFSPPVPPGGEGWDVAVVGAGPAGALVARELAREGLEVILLDRQAFPRWKVCGACLSPGGQEVLRQAGLGRVLEDLGPVPLDSLRLKGWGREAVLPLPGSVAVSRSRFDLALVRSGQDQGVHFLPETRARWEGLVEGWAELRVEKEGVSSTLRARVVVAADGLRSPVMREALKAQDSQREKSNGKVGLGARFSGLAGSYEAGVIHMAVGPGGYVGLVRVEDGTLNVGAALEGEYLRKEGGPCPAVNRILAGAGFPRLPEVTIQGWKGTPRLSWVPPVSASQRLFAVGDAAGYVEPFTGEGMAWALAGALALAPLAAQGARAWDDTLIRDWTQVLGQSVIPAQRLCRRAAWTLRRPRLARAILSLLRWAPQLAAPLVQQTATPAYPVQGRSS